MRSGWSRAWASVCRVQARCELVPGTADSSGCGLVGRHTGRFHGAAAALALDGRAGAAGGLDALARARAERVGVNRERLAELALGEDLDRDALAGAEAVCLHQLDRHLGAGVEEPVERGDVDRL